jgi:hypothetical protein
MRHYVTTTPITPSLNALDNALNCDHNLIKPTSYKKVLQGAWVQLDFTLSEWFISNVEAVMLQVIEQHPPPTRKRTRVITMVDLDSGSSRPKKAPINKPGSLSPSRTTAAKVLNLFLYLLRDCLCL